MIPHLTSGGNDNGYFIVLKMPLSNYPHLLGGESYGYFIFGFEARRDARYFCNLLSPKWGSSSVVEQL